MCCLILLFQMKKKNKIVLKESFIREIRGYLNGSIKRELQYRRFIRTDRKV